MYEIKELANEDSINISTTCPYTNVELEQMNTDYMNLSPNSFAKKYKASLFRPSYLNETSGRTPIQMNFCTNPFCKWFGLNQIRFGNVSGKPYRYRMEDKTEVNVAKKIRCNKDALNEGHGVTMNCLTVSISNWSVAEEIKRLILINSISEKKAQYSFHKENCVSGNKNPFGNIEFFYRRGRSTGNSQKYQCKTCKKITNILPNVRENFSYNQKKNNILPLFSQLIVSRTPVKRACEILDISPKTYYQKLEWLYEKCLEFLDRHETNCFSNKEFDELWLNTDKMSYYLNNVRRKGRGGTYRGTGEDKLMTYLAASSEMKSRYVFRADIAYDFTITQEQIEADTIRYHDDHLHSFSRKNERLRIPFAPQQPTSNDTETVEEYTIKLLEFNKRKDYIEGIHVNSLYTALAHYFLINRMVHCNKWNFISDEDSTLINAIMRVFNQSIKNKQSHYFICRLDRTLSKNEAYTSYMASLRNRQQWARDNNMHELSQFEIQSHMIAEELSRHSIYDYIVVGNVSYPKRAKHSIKHPAPSIDEGVRYVDCITDLSDKPISELADYLTTVNSHSINDFFNRLRRSISILERPLVTARHENKSYIYSNYNPQYAQYATTIMRTFYNFCWAFNTYDGNVLTPAQRIGIADRQYQYKDIIYFS